jgi:hypothetical protein
MSFSIFSYLLVAERLRPRADSGAGFSVPALSERGVVDGLDPILVTNARRGFVVTRKNREGMARFGFSPCTLEEEPALLVDLVYRVASLSVEHGWVNRFKSVGEAIDSMSVSRFKPKNLVLPRGMVSRFTDDEGVQHGKVEGLQLLSTDLPDKCAILTADSPALGVYTRVGDYIGLQLYNVDKTLAVIESHELG